MKKSGIVRALFIFLLIIGSGISCFNIPRVELTERDLELSIEHDGYTRHFILHLPIQHRGADKLPLLIALHGGGGTAIGMIRLTLGRFNELADQHDFLVVYPQGLEKSWHDGRDDPISYAHKNNIDDIGFLQEIIAVMVKEYNADAEKIFVTGISNGGFMSIRISRDLASQVRAVAPVCANIPVATEELHQSAPPMNVLLINGTADPLVPYNGGYVEVLGKKRGKVISTEGSINIFADRNDYGGVPQVEDLENRDPDDGTKVIREEYVNATTGKAVVLLKVAGGGHTWPGGWQYLSEKLIGRTSKDINLCDEIWAFFSTLE